jgi:hypothetical protein
MSWDDPIDEEFFKLVKSQVENLHETPRGQAFLHFLELLSGRIEPKHDGTTPSILMEKGRDEMVATIQNFNRLTPEQIVAQYL